MIPLILAFFSLLFIPYWDGPNVVTSKLLFVAFLLILVETPTKLNFELPQYLFLAWLAWAAICCFSSDHVQLAVNGFHLRLEGLITYVLLATYAVYYWWIFRNISALRWFLAVALVIIPLLYMFLPQRTFQIVVMTEIAMAAMASLGAVLLWGLTPSTILIALLAIVLSANRTACVSMFSGIVVYFILQKMRFKREIILIVLVIACILPFTQLARRFSDINFETLGTGARTQWLVQAFKLSQDRPILGYGLDTLSLYLKPATGPTQEAAVLTDKVHNIAFDIILQTGYPGFLLAFACLVSAIFITYKHRTEQNIACLAVVIAWLAFGMLNPHGILGHLVMIVSLFGIKRTSTKHAINSYYPDLDPPQPILR